MSIVSTFLSYAGRAGGINRKEATAMEKQKMIVEVKPEGLDELEEQLNRINKKAKKANHLLEKVIGLKEKLES